MFLITYIPTNVPVGKWQVDVDENGSLATYEELETALERVKRIRELGGEACLSVVIE